MPKTANLTESEIVSVTLSRQSIHLLDELAGKGIYGRNRAEVAGRFIDEALQRLVEPPRLKIQELKTKRGR